MHLCMVLVNDSLGSSILLYGLVRNGRAVLIAATYIHNIPFLSPEISHISIGRKIGTCQVANDKADLILQALIQRITLDS